MAQELNRDGLKEVVKKMIREEIAKGNIDEGFLSGIAGLTNKAKETYKQASAEGDKKAAFKKCVKYYNQNSEAFKKVQQVIGKIKEMGNKYGFSYEDVKNAARQAR